MFLAVGTGAYVAGVFHLVTHAFFKALLFLGAGSVIHSMHHAYHATHSHEDAQDMRNMGGLRRAMPWTFALMAIATLAIAGIPPFSGFFSKDEILASAFARGAELPLFRVFWFLGVIAAALTAFYMARLMAMTFFGENRTGAEEQKHLHEAPLIMTVPLAVLGVLSAVGGMLNLPALFGGHARLEHWLDPVIEGAQHYFPLEMPHGQTEFILIGLAIAIGLGGLIAGWRVTMARPILPARDATPEMGFWKVLYHKYYVDEIYDALIVRPLLRFSDRVLWKDVDQGMIDRGGVEGSAGLARALGWIGTRLQTGQVGVYLTVFLVGALGIFFVVMG
jgi:NADH-quinone oxidoreductase subunit L